MSDVDPSNTGIYEDRKEAEGQNASDLVAYWLDELKLASDDEKEWRKDVKEALDTFSGCGKGYGDVSQGTQFNVYFSNIQTLVPALYNSTPIPDVRRRFGDADSVAASVADFIERGLAYSIDSYSFDQSLEDAVFDLALPGRAIVRISYQPITGMVSNDQGQGYEDVISQNALCEHVPWDSFRRGPGKKWSDCPWIAFQHHYTKEALVELCGRALAEKVPQDAHYAREEDQEKYPKPPPSVMKLTECWEIWDKVEKRVYFIAPAYKDRPLKEMDDPLNLTGFFPIPEPMMAVKRAGSLKPICEYAIYRELLEELEEISERLRRLVQSLRPRALFGGKATEMRAISEADDLELIEVLDQAAFLDQGGIEKIISWFPLDPISKAIAELSQRREIVKANIFEVTGMADIMRGQTDPNETLGAQQIKAKWGALRIQKRQKEVQRFVRDLFCLKAEVICTKYNLELLGYMLGVQVTPEMMDIMQTDGVRSFKVDIETDSTVQNSMSHDLNTMTQFVQATGQYFQSMAPAVQMGIMTPPAVAQIYATFASNFNLGSQLQTVLDGLPQAVIQMQQAMQQQPKPEQLKLQADQQKQQGEMQVAQQELQMKGQEIQMNLQAKQAEMQMAQENHQMEMQFKFEEHQQNMALEREKMGQQAALEERKMDHQSILESRKIDNQNAVEGAKMDREDARAQQDMAMRGDELKFQRNVKFAEATAKGEKPPEGAEEGAPPAFMPLDELEKAMAQMAQAMTLLTQVAAQQAQSAQRIEQILAAPAQLIRDAAGRPVGAQKMLQGTPTLQ